MNVSAHDRISIRAQRSHSQQSMNSGIFIKRNRTLSRDTAKRRNCSISSERSISVLFYTVFLFAPVTEAFCRSVRGLVGSVNSIDTLLCYALLAALVIRSLPRLLKRIRLADLVLFIAIPSALYISSLFSKRPDIQYSIITDVLTRCIPAYLIAISLRDMEDAYDHLQITAFIMLLTQIILLVFFPSSSNSSDAHSQVIGYNVAFSCTVFLSRIKRKRGNVLDFVGLTASVAMMFMAETRGPFLCIILYLIISLLIYLKPINLKKACVLSAAVLAGYLVYASLTDLLQLLSRLFSSLGIGYSNRILNRILSSNSISFDLGRSYIQDAATAYIRQNWLFGCGLANDRVIIGKSAIIWGDAIGAYPHNIALEFFMQFGLPIGIILCLGLLWIIKKSIFTDKEGTASELSLILLTVGVCPLLVSGSYLNWVLFYVFIGVFIARRRAVKQKTLVWRGMPAAADCHYGRIITERDPNEK